MPTVNYKNLSITQLLKDYLQIVFEKRNSAAREQTRTSLKVQCSHFK